MRFGEQVETDPEPLVGLFRARDRLEDEVDRRATTDGLDGCRDMAETAGLRRNVESLSDLVEQCHNPHVIFYAIGRWIDADHGVADAEQKSVEQAGCDSARIVGWVVRLEPCREPSR